MPRQVQIAPYRDGEEVWLPVSEVRKQKQGFAPLHEGALVRGKLEQRVGGALKPGISRTWSVEVRELKDDAGDQLSIQVSSRYFTRYSKILILRIGDWKTEAATLNPLAESLESQLSLLLPPDSVAVEYIRTLEELSAALKVHKGGLLDGQRRQSHPWGYAVIVGHGRAGDSPGIRFGDSWRTPNQIVKAVKGLGPGGRTFSQAKLISLCCETGDERFAKGFSDALNTAWVGPKGAVHSFEAAGFVQRLFFEHFLLGQTWTNAFRATQADTMSFGTVFSCWLDGDRV